MPDLELWEIEDAIVAIITAEVAGIQAKPVDALEADISWLVQRSPSVLVACEQEMLADEKQPLDMRCRIFRVDIQLIFCFTGMRPRDERRVPSHPLLADVRDAIWNEFLDNTRSPIVYLGIGGKQYREEKRMLTISQLYTLTVTRRSVK